MSKRQSDGDEDPKGRKADRADSATKAIKVNRGKGGKQGNRGENPDFAEVLGALIQSRETSVRDLAAALDVDISLVYKWLRRERTPALTSEHLDAIARYLRLDTAERMALRAAQGRSLKQDRPKQSLPGRVVALIGGIVTRKASAPDDSDLARKTPALAPDRPVIRPSEHMQQVVLNVIGGALKPEPPCEHTMLCTFQGEDEATTDDGDPRMRWQGAMRRALRDGWRIEHVWRLNRDVERSVSLVASTLDLLGAGEYQPLYIAGAETLSPPYDLIIRPDVALVLLATQNAAHVDAALVTHDTDQIRLWREHYMQLRALARPPLQRFFPHESTEAGRLLTTSEEQHPGRDFVKYGLSLLTEPAAWSHPEAHWARLIREQGFDLARFLEYRQRRIVAFQRHVRTAVYRDICPEQAIEMMVTTGAYLANGAREPQLQLSRKDRREHLANVIRLLREHEKYQLALVPDEALDRVRVAQDTFWEVLGGTQALLNTPTRGAAGTEAARPGAAMDVVITEPRVAAAFQAYFDSLWERIPPLNREKRYVIWWLERQLERLPA